MSKKTVNKSEKCMNKTACNNVCVYVVIYVIVYYGCMYMLKSVAYIWGRFRYGMFFREKQNIRTLKVDVSSFATSLATVNIKTEFRKSWSHPYRARIHCWLAISLDFRLNYGERIVAELTHHFTPCRRGICWMVNSLPFRKWMNHFTSSSTML
jgi:hypothetical protein